MTEDEMVGWHHRLNGHGFEQALGVGDGQRSTISDAGSLCTEIPRRGGQSPSPSLPLPWAVSQLSPQEAVSSRPFPL